ncbi:MAG: pyridoxamine 5'-phosphate oxidase family protein [Leifsonia flava]
MSTETSSTSGAAASALFDQANPAHVKALEKLDSEIIAWITTVRSDGAPRSVPVWFLWHEGTVLVMSEPTTAKVQAIRRGSAVQLHLETGPFGSEVVILSGSAEISETDATGWLPRIRDAYSTKYAEAMADYGMDIEPIMAQFSSVIVFTPEKLSAW